MTTTMLPEQFSSLEPFSDWIVATEPERYDKRTSSTMAEMQAFYDAAFPLIHEAMAYLDQYDIKDLPPEARNLELLYFALINVSFPVEVWSQPRVPDSGAATFPCVEEFPY